jgi:hypothetical protein
MEAKRHALEAIVTRRPAMVEPGPEEQAEESPQKSPHGLQNGRKQVNKKQAVAKSENASETKNAEGDCSETPTITRHFDVGYHRSPHSRAFLRILGELRRGISR